MSEHLEITAANGTAFRVTYGRRTRYVERPVVAFYDTKYDDRFPLGQFVAEYYPEVIEELATLGHGLDLHMGIPAWQVDGQTMRSIGDWLAKERHTDFVADNAVDFNVHGNLTADNVVITRGLRVWTNEMKAGVVGNEHGATCCGDITHRSAQIKFGEAWFTDHKAGNEAVSEGCGCRHNHWFDVTYDDGGGGMFDGERMTTKFQGRNA